MWKKFFLFWWQSGSYWKNWGTESLFAQRLRIFLEYSKYFGVIVLSKVLSIIDYEMDGYRGMNDLDIAKHLIDKSHHDFDGDIFTKITLDEIYENIDTLKQK